MLKHLYPFFDLPERPRPEYLQASVWINEAGQFLDDWDGVTDDLKEALIYTGFTPAQSDEEFTVTLLPVDVRLNLARHPRLL